MDNINKQNFYKSIKDFKLQDIENYVRKLNNLYHKDGTPSVDDELYDMFVEYIKKKDPTNKILSEIGEVKENDFIKLPVFLGTEEKTYEKDDKLTKWKKKNNIQDTESLILSAKADGICLLIYGSTIFTRGDGNFGREKTEFKKYFPFDIDDLRVRGELIIKKKHNFKNPRNIVCGQVNKKKVDDEFGKYFTFLGYDVINNETQEKKFKYMKSKNINTVDYIKVESSKVTYDYLKNLLEKWKLELEYNIDGIVIRDNRQHNFEEKKKWSISYKHNFNSYKAKVSEINWNVSKSGKLIPVAVLDPPVVIDDSNIRKVTCNNAKFVIDNCIGTGSIIYIRKSGDIIPTIEKVESSGVVKLPDSSFLKGVHLYSKSETDKNLKKIFYFLKYFKYDKIGFKTLEKINKTLKLRNIFSFLKMENKDLSFMGDKTSKLLVSTISDIKKKKIYIVDLLSSISLFDNISSKRLDFIFKHHNDILSYDENTMRNEIIKLKGFKEKITDEFVERIKYFIDNKRRFNKYFDITYHKVDDDNSIKIAISGFRDLSLIKGDVEVVSLNNADFLIVKDNKKETTKTKQALEKKKKILSIEEFNKWISVPKLNN